MNANKTKIGPADVAKLLAGVEKLIAMRGKKVDVALADLEFSRKRIARDVRKCVMSAVANAENNHNLDVNDLMVTEAHVGKNIVIRRFHARGKGRMSPVQRPFSQLTVVVREVEEAQQETRRRAGAGEGAAAGEDAQAKETA